MPSVSVGSAARAVGEQFDDGGTRATGDRVFFDGDERGVRARQTQHQFFVERFHEPHVDHRGVETLADDLGRFHERAESRG